MLADLSERERKERLALALQEKAIRAERARQQELPGGLLAFIRYFWHILEPARPFVEGWPVEAVCAHLEAITRGDLTGERVLTRLLANVPPGFMKPVWEEELVVTRRGRIHLRDVVVGDEVLTHKGRVRSVLCVHEPGDLPLRKVTTFSGRAAVTAPDHPFLTTRGWVKAEDLEDGDRLAYLGCGFETQARMVSPEAARLLGYFVGDGCVKYAQATITNMDEAVLLDVERCAAALGFHTWRKERAGNRATSIVVKAIDGRWNGTNGTDPFWAWLEGHGLRGSCS